MNKLGKKNNSVKEVVRVKNLSKNYRQKTVLKDINFKVKKGTIHGLIGPNGAGKSTILKCLMGLVIPHPKSKIYIERDQVGYARAEPKFPDYRVEQIVFDCVKFLNLCFKRAKNPLISLHQAEQKLSNSLLNQYRKQKFSSLSTGWKKILQLFILTLHEPTILILDEPFNGLDATFQAQLTKSLKKARQNGCSILLSTHTLSDLQALADEITIIKQGQTVYTGPKIPDLQKTYQELFLEELNYVRALSLLL